MAPNATEQSGVLCESEAADLGIASAHISKADDHKWTYKWNDISFFVFVHVAGLYGAYLMCVSAKWQTDLYAAFMYAVSILGITAGSHRLWSHKAYKAKLPLRLLLAIICTPAGIPVIEWVRLHRTHHKYADTDADPHNVNRGFFYSHVGWSLVSEHPEYLRKRKEIDLSDLYSDPVLRFQNKYFSVLMGLYSFVIPTMVPVFLWSESWTNSFFVATMFRIFFCTHVTACINSVAHMWGNKPYDVAIKSTETFLTRVITLGEGSHNYHHTFPWDYRTSEFSIFSDWATHFINLSAKIGLAYDLKRVSQDMIHKRLKRTGDGSHPRAGDEATSTSLTNAATR